MGTIGDSSVQTLKSAPAFFDASNYLVEQHFVASKDGTRVPYFQIGPRDPALDGSNPTVLNGYGGFEIARTPAYNGQSGVPGSSAAESMSSPTFEAVASTDRRGIMPRLTQNASARTRISPPWRRTSSTEV